jgi:omega-6 fatty acid desaturase (delta-12 desaturase)
MPEIQELKTALMRYRQPSPRRSFFELAITSAALAGSWLLMWLSLKVGYWLTLILAVPAAGLLVRLFLIQHDCGHGSFFKHKALNDWVGRILGVVTFTPYDYWKRNHAIHHATSNNLDRRGIGDIETLTVREYQSLPAGKRLCYQLYRNAIVMFAIGAPYVFLIKQRLPIYQMRAGWRPWLSTMSTNVAIAAAAAGMIWLVGAKPFLLVHMPIALLAASMGVWLFYVQHQFDDVTWARGSEWNHQDAALAGSSYYDLPPLLRWFTANIGVHHVHHMNSRIPYYRLPQVLDDHPELKEVGRLTLRESFRTVRLALWCETRKKLVSFTDTRDSGFAGRRAK